MIMGYSVFIITFCCPWLFQNTDGCFIDTYVMCMSCVWMSLIAFSVCICLIGYKACWLPYKACTDGTYHIGTCTQ